MQKSATIVVFYNKQILLLRRGPSAPWKPGRYCLPGGRRDKDESIINCAIRELYEETGIVVAEDDVFPVTVTYSSNYSKIVFVTKITHNTVVLNWEHDRYVWVDYNKVAQYSLVPGLSSTLRFVTSRAM